MYVIHIFVANIVKHTHSCFSDLVEVKLKLQKFLKKNSEAILFNSQKPKATCSGKKQTGFPFSSKIFANNDALAVLMVLNCNSLGLLC